ncbi:MAG TPA: TIGR04141 family sporadically distributed protein [Pseudonocardiaceae bacterium]|nr:TIGR04141 family sporadically distributed protein [Pseudonocardiaceae bacterium]
MPQSSSRMVTLYRLTGATDLRHYLTTPAAASDVKDRRFERDGIQCFLRYGYVTSAAPQWRAHIESLFGEPVLLPQVDPFAVLLIERPPWVYALAWGSGYLLLKDDFVEHGFGLSFGIARLDEYRLGSVRSHALDSSSRIAEVSFPQGAYVGQFGIRQHGALVSQVKGPADLSDLECCRDSVRTTRGIQAGDQLKIPLAYDFTALVRDIDVIAGVTDAPVGDNALRAMAQTRRLRKGHRLVRELERRLSLAIGGADTGQLDLGWPVGSVDYGDAESFRILSLGRGGQLHLPKPLTLDDLVTRLRPLPADDRMAALRRGHVFAYSDEEGTAQLGGGTSARKWIAFETVVDDNRYVLRGGEWIRIGEAYVDQIRQEVDYLLTHTTDLTFPLWTRSGGQDDEHRYCERVAETSDMLCFDRKFAATARHRTIELCDLLGPANELVHVKWLSGAPAFSHLISQAEASITALQNEPGALAWLRTEVERRTGGVRTIRAVPDTIVLAAGGRRWTSDTLFAMSQISLLTFYHSLPRNVGLRFADIPYEPKQRRRDLR